jgi:hypothetical protein
MPGRWRFVLWVTVWLLALPCLLVAASVGAAAAPVAALAATLAAALLCAFGWGLRGERVAPPPWRVGLGLGAALLALGVGAGASAMLGGRPWPVWAVIGTTALVAYHRWSAHGLPPGFAHRITGAARAFALAAAALWVPALAAGVGGVLRLPATGLGAAAGLGVLPLACGAILWEYVRPHLGGRRPASAVRARRGA